MQSPKLTKLENTNIKYEYLDKQTLKLIKLIIPISRIQAEEVLEKAQKVVEALKAAKEAQEEAEKAINTAHKDITATKKDLKQVFF